MTKENITKEQFRKEMFNRLSTEGGLAESKEELAFIDPIIDEIERESLFPDWQGHLDGKVEGEDFDYRFRSAIAPGRLKKIWATASWANPDGTVKEEYKYQDYCERCKPDKLKEEDEKSC